MAAMVSSNMPAIPRLIFRVAMQQKKARFFVAALVQIMKQGRVGIARQLICQFVDPGEQRQQVRLGVRLRHRFHHFGEVHQRAEQAAIKYRIHVQKGNLAAIRETESVSDPK